MYKPTKTDTVQIALSAFVTFIYFYGDFQQFLADNGEVGTALCIGMVFLIASFVLRGIAESITGEWI